MDSKTERAVKVTKEALPYIAAIVLLILYGVFLIFLAIKAENNEVSAEEWNRYVYLVSGIEAVTFGAAGFLFGREVNRQRAESAEAELKTAREQEIKAAVTAAQNQKVLEFVQARVRRLEEKYEDISVPIDPQAEFEDPEVLTASGQAKN